MGKLLLESLEIQNFRGFRHLQIEKLGRVNLIVGKNNIGKTALLEALHLYARKDGSALVWEMLQARDELRKTPSQLEIEDLLEALKYLFFNCKDVRKYTDAILVGPMEAPGEVLKILVEGFDEKERKSLSYEEMSSTVNLLPRLKFQWGDTAGVSYPITPNALYGFLVADVPLVSSIFISAGGLSKESIVALWDGIALTAFEKDVIEALRILAPGIEGVNFIGDAPAKRRSVLREAALKDSAATRSRIPIVRIAGGDDPLPLRTLGNGMLHILEIILASINSHGGVLLIDEVENGIHYSAQQELWQMIFRLADRLNVQVFATTHSWDCIEAFQKAAENQREEGMLMRLSLKGDDIKPVLYDRRRLEIATREEIEVR